MNKQKFNRKEYIINIINKLCFLLVMSIILYYPLKFAKHYLYDTTYQNILVKFAWRPDSCESHSGESKLECSCEYGIIGLDDKNFKITKDGYLHWKHQLVGKVVLIEKPSFFTTGEILTGGYMKIIDSETGDSCYYDSVIS
ncbi:hypothetical protein ABX014_12575 [Snodgrassella alvi]|uniref:hypothetical protein n=1 Tax=Snodgrassella alvi TaxID=1196083 RepID=UPI00351C5B5D